MVSDEVQAALDALVKELPENIVGKIGRVHQEYLELMGLLGVLFCSRNGDPNIPDAIRAAMDVGTDYFKNAFIHSVKDIRKGEGRGKI